MSRSLVDVRGGLIRLTSAIRIVFIEQHGQPRTILHPASTRTTPSHPPPHVPFTQRRFTTPSSDQTRGPGSAMHPHPRGAPTDHDPLPPPGLPSGQTLVQKLLQTPLPVQPAGLHSLPADVSAPVRLPVQLFARLHIPVSTAPAPAPTL